MRLDKYLEVSAPHQSAAPWRTKALRPRPHHGQRPRRPRVLRRQGRRPHRHPLRRAHPRGRGPLRGGQRRQGGRRRALPRAAEQLTQSRHNPDTPPIHSGVWEIMRKKYAMPCTPFPPLPPTASSSTGASA